MKTKNENEHNTFVHIDDNTFSMPTSTLYCFNLKDPKGIISHGILMYFIII